MLGTGTHTMALRPALRPSVTSNSRSRPTVAARPLLRQPALTHKRSWRQVAPPIQASAATDSDRGTGSSYYEVLGVPSTADTKTIKTAYRRLVRKYHPDVNRDPAAASTFMRIKAAYQVLSDDGQRAAYDRWRAAGRHDQTTSNWGRGSRDAGSGSGGESGGSGGSGNTGSGGGGSGSGGSGGSGSGGGGHGGSFWGPEFWGMAMAWWKRWVEGCDPFDLGFALGVLAGGSAVLLAAELGARRVFEKFPFGEPMPWWRCYLDSLGILFGMLLGIPRALVSVAASPFVRKKKSGALQF